MSAAALPDPAVLRGLHEHFAAGCFELTEASPMIRWSRAMRRFLETRSLPRYTGQALYPCGASGPPAPGNPAAADRARRAVRRGKRWLNGD